MKPHIKIQHDIKVQSEETVSYLQDMQNWQKEMVEKEKARLKGGQSEGTKIPEIRSNIQNSSDNLSDNKNIDISVEENENNDNTTAQLNEEAEKKSKETEKNEYGDSSSNLSKQNEGDLYKEKGNNLVKLGKHDEALYFYTAAIKHFDKEPIYFANRALCYLKLEKYKECIKDCDRAVELNKTNVKAHYRRMQAYECLGENEEALKCCQTVLKLDAKNVEAKKSHQRILNRIKKTEIIKEQKPNFTKSSDNIEEIELYNKPAHLRSKKSLKKIKIKEVIDGKSSQVQITDEILDKLFTNNNVGSYEEIKKSSKIQDKASIDDINMDNKINEKKSEEENNNSENAKEDLSEEQNKYQDEYKKIKSLKNNKKIKSENQIVSSRNKDLISNNDLVIPSNPTQLYSVWKELNSSQRYIYLQMIPVNKLNKILGAGLEPDMLTDIFTILNEFYLKDNLEIIDILKELAKHDEFKILSMFLSKDDRDMMLEFVKYMKKRNNNSKDIEYIEYMYYLNE